MTPSSISPQEAAERDQLGNRLDKLEYERIFRLSSVLVKVDPLKVLDLLTTKQLIDYLRIYRKREFEEFNRGD